MKNEILISNLKNLVATERKITGKILNYLREIELRKLHLEMGYASMFDFCVKELKYSSSAASRRVSAMRIIKAVPEIQEKLEDGRVNLSTLTQIQNFIRAEEKTRCEKLDVSQKRELLELIENKSQKEVEQALVKISPASTIPQYKERLVSEDKIELRIVVNNRFRDKLGQMRRLNSHRSIEIADVLERALDLAIGKLDPEGRSKHLRPKSEAEIQEEAEDKYWDEQKFVGVDVTKENSKSYEGFLKKGESTRYIPKKVRQKVFNRAAGQCEFRNSKTGLRCGATLFLEFDHVHPFAKGGKNDEDNLQMLCGAHNKLKAEKDFCGPPPFH